MPTSLDDLKERAAFGQRLNDICTAMHLPPKGKARQKHLAKLFGVTENGARKWLEGIGYPTIDNCRRICQWADVTIEYLLLGGQIDNVAHKAEPGAPEIAYVVTMMRRMTPEQRSLSVRVLNQLPCG